MVGIVLVLIAKRIQNFWIFKLKVLLSVVKVDLWLGKTVDFFGLK